MTRTGRVLVIEDEASFADALAEGLRHDGFEVETATDGLLGLDAGLTRPFDAIVLDLMLPGLPGLDLCAQLRRAGIRVPVLVLTAGDLALDRVTRRCRRGESVIELTPREFALLELLMSRPGQVVSKRFVLDEVWDSAIPVHSNVLEVYVAYLRRKIDQPFGRHAVETVRGTGYRLAPDGG